MTMLWTPSWPPRLMNCSSAGTVELGAVEAEALGAGIFHVDEALEDLGLHQLLEDGFFAFGREAHLAAFDAILDPGALGRIGDVHVLRADGAAIGPLQDVEDLPQRREFEAERPANENGTVIVALGEAVGLGLELRMLAAARELQGIEIGDEMAARAVGADQHARAERIARGIKRFGLGEGRDRARGALRPWCSCAVTGPGGAARLGQNRILVVMEASEERGKLRIDRARVLLITGVKLGEIGGVRAMQERRAEEHVVQLMPCHRIKSCRSLSTPA